MTDYTYNTGNPIGSTDVRDGVDNLKSFDVLLNSTDDTYQDRLGNTVPTAAGAIKRLGPVVVSWTFTTGGTLNYPNEAALNPVDGNYYGWTGVFPHAVAPGADPTLPGSGYVPRTDVVLRGELAQVDGANLVGGATYAQIRSYTGQASKIHCLGKTHLFDGGAGDFQRDDSDLSSTDNGMTTLVDALGRRWKRSFDGVACVEWAEGSSDRLMIKKALAAKIPLQMHAGSDYVWDGTDAMEIDVGYTSLNCNSSKITFSGFTDATTESAIKFISTLPQTPDDYWVPQNTTKPLSNLIIIGPKGTGVGAAFSSTCTGLDIDAAHLNIHGVFVYGFGHGFKVGTNGYCIAAYACNIGECAKGITAIDGGSNYGESIELFGCKIYDNAVGINNNCPTGVIRMIGGSLDYNLKQVVGTNSSTTELTSTWFECNDAGAGNVHIDLSGSSTFRMKGGHVQQNGTPGELAQLGLVRTDSTSKARFSGVHMFNTKNTANVLDAGSGLCTVEDTDSYPVSYLPSRIANVAGNKLSDGGFATESVADMWFIYADTAAITDRLNGENVDIALSTDFALSGTKSLKLSKVAGGAEGTIAVCVPVKAGSRAAFTGSYYKPAGAGTGGTIFVTTQAVKIEGIKASGCPNVLNSISYDTLGIGGTDSEIQWTQIGTGMDRIVPSWATHFLVGINAVGFQGDVYFDDWNISTM